MEVYVGRQPIFDQNQELYAYELLYRSSEQNRYYGIDGSKATSDVIVNTFINIGVEKISNGKKCFINFTEELLLNDIPTYFNPSMVVIEILEDVVPTQEVLDSIKNLKTLGYTIALDDFVLNEDNQVFIQYADIIKIDFTQTSVQAIIRLLNEKQSKHIKFLAEKIETREEYLIAKSLGFHLFQGYFFSKPIVVKGKSMKKHINDKYIQILHELNSIEPEIDLIVKYVESDLSLTYKLLRLVNSAAFHMRNKVQSVKQAILILGLYELRKWITVLAINIDGDHVNSEVLMMSMCRAKLAEQISKHGTFSSSEFFLLGMFSLIDTLLNCTMERILEELPLSMDVKSALLGKEGPIGAILDIFSALESGKLEGLPPVLSEYNLSEEMLYEYYLKAQTWSNNIILSIE